MYCDYLRYVMHISGKGWLSYYLYSYRPNWLERIFVRQQASSKISKNLYFVKISRFYSTITFKEDLCMCFLTEIQSDITIKISTHHHSHSLYLHITDIKNNNCMMREIIDFAHFEFAVIYLLCGNYVIALFLIFYLFIEATMHSIRYLNGQKN